MSQKGGTLLLIKQALPLPTALPHLCLAFNCLSGDNWRQLATSAAALPPHTLDLHCCGLPEF